MCAVSLACPDPGGRWGFSALPTATLGLIQIPLPIKATNTESQGWRDAFGSFSPSVGITNRLWFEYGWVDVHSQILYGLAVENNDDYIWGVTGGFGWLFAVLNVDLAFINRREKKNSVNVDHGTALLINLDLTAAGIALGSGGVPLVAEKQEAPQAVTQQPE